jgi:predicted amidohydrolase
MRVALVQMTSTDKLSENLESARRAVDEPAARM